MVLDKRANRFELEYFKSLIDLFEPTSKSKKILLSLDLSQFFLSFLVIEFEFPIIFNLKLNFKFQILTKIATRFPIFHYPNISNIEKPIKLYKPLVYRERISLEL